MRPFANAAGNEEAVDIWGSIYHFKALGEQTGDAYTLVEVHGRTGFETPLHSHDNEEEGFYVLDGEVELIVGEQTIKAPPGTFAFAPRGLAHGFRFGSDARILLLVSPGASGHEGMFREVGEPAANGIGPSLPSLPSDVEAVAEIARRHGTRLLGPLP